LREKLNEMAAFIPPPPPPLTRTLSADGIERPTLVLGSKHRLPFAVQSHAFRYLLITDFHALWWSSRGIGRPIVIHHLRDVREVILTDVGAPMGEKMIAPICWSLSMLTTYARSLHRLVLAASDVRWPQPVPDMKVPLTSLRPDERSLRTRLLRVGDLQATTVHANQSTFRELWSESRLKNEKTLAALLTCPNLIRFNPHCIGIDQRTMADMMHQAITKYSKLESVGALTTQGPCDGPSLIPSVLTSLLNAGTTYSYTVISFRLL
jgi:hypothetical protein